MIGEIFSSIKSENSDPYFAEIIGKVRVNISYIRKINIMSCITSLNDTYIHTYIRTLKQSLLYTERLTQFIYDAYFYKSNLMYNITQ